MYGCGAEKIEIVYRPGKENGNADALSRTPYLPAPDTEVCQDEVQVSVVRSDSSIPELFSAASATSTPTEVGEEQNKDPNVEPLMSYLCDGAIPAEKQVAQRVIAQAPLFTIVEGTLYILDKRQKDRLRIVVPDHLKQSIMKENHAAVMAGHFSGQRLHKALERRWWWQL